ncbi:ankyrin repeat domain 52 [Coprinopsis cinerea okayama7|uniref:Ankyrin repeat domain 52 n=1 Tax=Coprinopsis cinerea (strain Okayama-7 / 130 / ATCC MYA-4618 / FGSC 9003) TaxID=240176 RepID=A8N4R2_COPC7|nr:ankyrin repeat domain 52 [Coprinopsis cinerea okayama7\|eukprot:XP_001829857.2 ankyrin repeat domain 52 [Coprinopsis cinerea okayama7\
MGQQLSGNTTSDKAHNNPVPGAYDLNDQDTTFNNPRTVEISGGNHYAIGRDFVQIEISNYIASSTPNDRMCTGARLRRIRTWLAPNVNFRSIHMDVRKKRIPGTGHWFLKSRLYREWKKSKSGILWGMGIPGAGKTVLASNVADDLLSLAEGTDNICVLMVYSRYTEPVTVDDILKALIKQCIERHPDLVAVVEPLYERHTLEETEPSLDELVELLQTLEQYFDCVFYIIDGVDEVLNEVQFDFIRAINCLRGNFILTSRPLDDLGTNLEGAVFFTILAQDEDIQLLVQERLERYPGLSRILDANNFRAEATAQIQRKAAGMFLHAALQLEELQRCLSLASAKQKLEQFPSGLQGMYASAMERIEAQWPEHRDMAKLALLWVVLSRTPLSVRDLQYALGTQQQSHALDQQPTLPDGPSIIAACCGLLEVHGDKELVRLIHFTAKDALAPMLLADFPSPHALIAKVLIKRLESSGMHKDNPSSKEELGALLDRQPLLRYARDHWGHHVSECDYPSEIAPLVEGFLQQCTAFPSDDWDALDFYYPLHVAARYGLTPYLERVVNCGWDINSRTRHRQRTPLIIAANAHLESVVRRLLGFDKIDANAMSVAGWTALMGAARGGEERIVDQLVQFGGTEVNRANVVGWTALMSASRNGHVGTVKRLLRVPGIDVNATNGSGRTALMFAAWYGHEATLQSLLSFPGALVDVADVDGQTALMLAAGNGHQANVKLLLQAPGILVNAADKNGWTALMSASKKGWEGAVQQLLDFPGIDVNAANAEGRTSLMVASWTHKRCTEVTQGQGYRPQCIRCVWMDGSYHCIKIWHDRHRPAFAGMRGTRGQRYERGPTVGFDGSLPVWL